MKIAIDYDNLTLSSWGGTNTHLVASYNVGITEKGSSGAPLYSANRKIIGQLHGNQLTQYNWCAEKRGEFGRFDLSWEGGGTPETALKYWLDPNSTGVSSTTTTYVSNLIESNPSLSITGLPTDNYICSGSSSYTLNSLPQNAAVTWTISNPAIASIPNPSNGPNVNLTRLGSGVVTLTAMVTLCSGETRSINKSIMIGASVGGYYTIISNYNNPAIQINLSNSNSPLWLPKNQGFGINAYINSPAVNSVTWSRATNSYNFSYSSSGSVLSFMGNSSGISYEQRNGIFNINASTACGTYIGSFTWPIIAQGWSFSLKTSPNPATSTMNVTIENESPDIKNLKSSEKISIALYNFNTNILLKEWNFVNAQPSFMLDIPEHKHGQYILVVKKGQEQQSKIIILE